MLIDYREFRPSRALAGHIECYWVMVGAPGRGAPIERILPDGCVEVVFHLDEPFRAFSESGASIAQPAAFAVGPSTRFLLIQPPPRVRTFGIRFRPGGGRLLLPMPLQEIAEQTAPLDALIGSEGRWLREHVGDAGDAETMVRVVETSMLGRLGRMRWQTGSRLRPMIRDILRSRGALTVAELARQAGVSRRQLERQFLADVGLGPKAVSRLVRFQAVLEATIRRGRIDWADVALNCGYSDQAHLIREIRAFSGETPRTLPGSQGQLSRHFASPERLRAFFTSN